MNGNVNSNYAPSSGMGSNVNVNGNANTSASQDARTERGWHGIAFLVEALVLLTFIAASMAVFFTLFANSTAMGTKSAQLTMATTMATNEAELLAADPAGYYARSESISMKGDLAVRSTVKPQVTKAGVLYVATFDVYRVDDLTGKDGLADAEAVSEEAEAEALEPVYSLTTSRYVSRESLEKTKAGRASLAKIEKRSGVSS